MTDVFVNASAAYTVHIGAGLLTRVGALAAEAGCAGKALLLSDRNVFALYGETVLASLRAAGFTVSAFQHEPGEEAKSVSVWTRLTLAMQEAGLDRSSTLFALGGGVTGDLGGFAAATWQRGIACVQIPTSLLAAVDSSVGGKTALDLPGGKNQIGAFLQPKTVVCDPETFRTLPERERACGMAEVIKYGVLAGGALWERLNAEADPVTEETLADCVAYKARLVEKDERDRGERKLLNLGHTIGHAAEACSGFTLPHGEAVAIGLAAMVRAGAKTGTCSRETAERVLALLERYALPTACACPRGELLRAIREDKKCRADRIDLVIPRGIGDCAVETLPLERMEDFLAAAGL